jgi:2-polyprenyl-3-methyl-5-hydroxy-6-metoxy-1,4-benzoquinol methylase
VASAYQLKKDKYSSHSVILSLLGEGRGQRLLDIGAAQADMAQLLTSQGYEVTAVEGDPALASMGRGKCREVVVADLDQPLPDLHGPFDIVLYADVLEHLKDPQRALRDINQQLKPGGIVLVSVPNIAHLWVRLRLLRGKFDYMDRGILDRTHLRFFTRVSLEALLREAGLDLVKLTATPVPLPLVVPERYHGLIFRTVHGTNAILARAWKTMLGYQFIAVARKGVAR